MIQPDQIIRSNRKTLSISIDSLGRLIVRAPRVYPEERIFSFLQAKSGWIEKQRQKRAENRALLPGEDLDGYVFPLLGKQTEICLYDGGRVAFSAENSMLFLPKKNAVRRLKNWLKTNAERIFTSLARARAEEMGLSFSDLKVTSAKTRWGSCSGESSLHFSFRLLYAPREVVDYVVVHELAHELAHIPHRNHGARFWSLVEKFVPDHARMRKWLKENSFLMEIF